MGNMGTRHMNAEEIEKYSLGGLSEEQAAPFDEHLLLCEVCRKSVEASDAYVAAMRGAARQVRQRDMPAKPGRKPGAGARAANSVG